MRVFLALGFFALTPTNPQSGSPAPRPDADVVDVMDCHHKLSGIVDGSCGAGVSVGGGAGVAGSEALSGTGVALDEVEGIGGLMVLMSAKTRACCGAATMMSRIFEVLGPVSSGKSCSILSNSLSSCMNVCML